MDRRKRFHAIAQVERKVKGSDDVKREAVDNSSKDDLNIGAVGMEAESPQRGVLSVAGLGTDSPATAISHDLKARKAMG